MTPSELPIFLISIFMAGPRNTPVQRKSSALPRPIQRLQFVDQPRNDAQAAVPELRVARVEAEGCQEFGMMLGAAGGEHFEIALGKAGRRVLVDGIERVHQAIA